MRTYDTEVAELGELNEFGELGEFEGEGEGEGEFEFEGEGELAEFGEYHAQGEAAEFEGEGEGEFEFENEGEFELEQFLGGILGSILGGELESPLSESQEMELASELLEIASEQELEQFLGNMFKGVSRAVGGFIKSPVGRALGGVLKQVAKKALPVVGGALGSMVAPGIGTALGSKLGSMASGLFELELEAMPAEAAEFEVARRYVNLAAAAARSAAMARPRPGVNPNAVARAAVAQAARAYAPGVYRQMLRQLGAPAPVRRGAVAPMYRRAAGGYPAARGYGARRTGYPVRGVPAGYRRRRSTAWGPAAYRPAFAAIAVPEVSDQHRGGVRAIRGVVAATPGTAAGARPPAGVRPPAGLNRTRSVASPRRSVTSMATWGGGGAAPVYSGPVSSGRWYRRGRKIVVVGA